MSDIAAKSRTARPPAPAADPKRRYLLKAVAAGAALTGIGFSGIGHGRTARKARVGFCAPLTGEMAAKGLPGLHGCEIWAQRVNDSGGIGVGENSHPVELIAFDNEYDPERALHGFKRLVEDHAVSFVMMHGGETWSAVQQYATEHKMLTSTLLSDNLSIDSPYLVAPCDVNPIYKVTGVQWLAENFPEHKTVAVCGRTGIAGGISLTTYLSAFEVEQISVINRQTFAPEIADFAPIMRSMLAASPHVLCFDVARAEHIDALTELAFAQGFHGKIISGTCDNYRELVATTSERFMEGFIFQFPDFDDPKLNDAGVNFDTPNRFYEIYNERHPDTWSAVSWQYAATLDWWKAMVEKTASLDPMHVIDAVKAGKTAPHAFGEASWWGADFYGINNTLVGNWPVVTIQNGRARIAEFKSISEWWDKHQEILLRNMLHNRQMWYQRATQLTGDDDSAQALSPQG